MFNGTEVYFRSTLTSVDEFELTFPIVFLGSFTYPILFMPDTLNKAICTGSYWIRDLQWTKNIRNCREDPHVGPRKWCMT